MTAYVILIRDKMIDAEAFAAYGAKAKLAREGHAIKPLAYYGRYEALEGPAAEGVVIMEFPTYDEAKAWYDSPAYQEALQLRLKGAEYRVLIVEGV